MTRVSFWVILLTFPGTNRARVPSKPPTSPSALISYPSARPSRPCPISRTPLPTTPLREIDVLEHYLRNNPSCDLALIPRADRSSVTRWARMQLPNGQIARSMYCERYKSTARQARNVKVNTINLTRSCRFQLLYRSFKMKSFHLVRSSTTFAATLTNLTLSVLRWFACMVHPTKHYYEQHSIRSGPADLMRIHVML